MLVNPMIVAGQVHGAIAQGAGQALLEHVVYDANSGQPLSASFMDYAMPRADDLPSFDVSFNATRCSTNPLGVKGSGEAGAIALFPAIGNAVLDALAWLGVTDFAGPATPLQIWRAMQDV
jgi:carbon-monoxide dehydrogenase large subunit